MARILTITLNPALDLTVRLRQLELGAVNRSEAVLTQAAGKGLNVAQVLADLGHRLTVSGFLGEDNQPPFTAMLNGTRFSVSRTRVSARARALAHSRARLPTQPRARRKMDMEDSLSVAMFVVMAGHRRSSGT